jgi:hypothetical protein
MVDTRYQLQPNESTAAYNERVKQYYTPTSPATPQGWDQPTYNNFKGANPTLEPDKEDTARMQGAPSIKDLYGSISADDAQVDSTTDQFREIAQTPVDEGAIRSETLKRLQTEIDATNQVYAQKLVEAKKVGEQNLGSNAAISARRGLLGSDFGAAANSRVLEENLGREGGVAAEKNSAIQALFAKGEAMAQAEIAAKRGAKAEGATAYLNFLQQSEKRREERTKEAAKRALASGIDLNGIGQSEIKALAKSYGISPEALMAAYVDEVRADEDRTIDQSKKFAEIQKLFSQEQSVADQYGSGIIGEYNFAVANGYQGTFTDYQNEDANRKKSIAAAGNSFGLTPNQVFQATQSLKKTTQTNTAAARELQRQNSILQQTWNRFQSGEAKDLNGTTQAIITTFNKILDPTSVVRETEYDRSAQGQALISSILGKMAAVQQGGPGLTPQSLKELVDLGATYTSNAQTSIDTANRSAQEEAEYFGLNPEFVTTAGSATDEGGSETITAPDGTEVIIID